MSQTEFIVFLDDEANAIRVASGNSRPPRNDVLSLHCCRWTRQASASRAILPSLVDVELQGVPAHTWEVLAAENLLNPYGWVEKIHASTRNGEDYSVFHLKAWCLNPEQFPAVQNLIVIEPQP